MIRIETGDCLDILPSIEDRSVQMVYLDPPYASGRDWSSAGLPREVPQDVTAFVDSWESMDEYREYMALRLRECRRVLDGSLYLHCDDSAQHVLRSLCDDILSPARCKSTIIWERQYPHCDAKGWGRNIDMILYYADQSAIWHPEHRPHSGSALDRYSHVDTDGRTMARPQSMRWPATRCGIFLRVSRREAP